MLGNLPLTKNHTNMRKEARNTNSGFAQRGHLNFKKSSHCLEVSATFDTL
jgi:hypothetical protein